MSRPNPNFWTQLVASSKALAYSSAICSRSGMSTQASSKAFSVDLDMFRLILLDEVISAVMNGPPGLYKASELCLLCCVDSTFVNRSFRDCCVGVDIRGERGDGARVGVVGSDISTSLSASAIAQRERSGAFSVNRDI